MQFFKDFAVGIRSGNLVVGAVFCAASLGPFLQAVQHAGAIGAVIGGMRVVCAAQQAAGNCRDQKCGG